MLSPALDFVERTDTESYTDRMTAKHLKTTFAVVLLTAAGCSRPKQYRLGETIPIGSYTMSISMTEMPTWYTNANWLFFTAVPERVGPRSRNRNGRRFSVLAGRPGLDCSTGERTNMLRRKSCWQQCIGLIELLTKSLTPTMKTPG